MTITERDRLKVGDFVYWRCGNSLPCKGRVLALSAWVVDGSIPVAVHGQGLIYWAEYKDIEISIEAFGQSIASNT